MAVDFRQEGVPLIRLSGLSSSGSVLVGCNYLDLEKVRKRWAHFRVERGDTLLSTSAALGRVAVVDEAGAGAIPYTGIIRMRPRGDELRREFIPYLLEAPEFQTQAEAVGIGSVMRHFGPSHLRRMTVTLPPIATQRRIASILSTYDDLIENNTRRIQILEEMAQAIYREWFVEFRFPGHEGVRMVDSALGPIPDGWRVGPLADALHVSRNVINPSDAPHERFALYSFSAFDVDHAPVAELGAAIQSSKFLITEPCVLYAKLNPRIPRVWFADPELNLRALASSEFLVIRSTEAWGLALTYSVLRSPEFASRAVSMAAGTSTSHQRIKPNDLLSMAFAHPTPTLCRAFEQAVAPMLVLGDRLRHASHNLRSTRDLLLPRLISGEIDVSELDLGDV